jgi:hypothetical protein
VSSDHERTDDVAICNDDVINEDTPFNPEYDAGERAGRHVTRQLSADAFADRLERFLGIGADEWFELKPGDGSREIRHDGDDLCTRNYLEKCLDN